MLTCREFIASTEWRLVSAYLQERFGEAVSAALQEEKDIGVVRYNKGIVDTINMVLKLPEELLPDLHEDKVIVEQLEEPGNSFVNERPGSEVY